MQRGIRIVVSSTLDGEHFVNPRFLRPAVTACALTLPLLLPAQAAPKKPASQPRGSRAAPVTATAEPAPAVAAQPVTPPTHAPAPVVARDTKPAASVPPGEPVRFGLAAGLAAPMSSLGNAFSAGYTGLGFLQGRPEGMPVSLRGDLQYTRFTGQNEIVTPSYAVIQVTGAGVYDFSTAGGGTSPFFATAGLGLYRWSANNESQTDFGQNLGLGFKFRTYRFRPFVEGRFHFFNDVQYFTLTIAGHL
jgi:hypothetical protein